MSHLTSESLARLVNESPATGEDTHLAACAHCRHALDEMRAQTTALRALPALVPPSDAWEKIAARAEADRMIPPWQRWPFAVAARPVAAALLFSLGIATGVVLSRGQSSSPSDSAEGGISSAVTTAASPTSPDIALARLRIAEVMYTSALLDYAAITSPEPPRDAVARLATLESIVLTTRIALERAPADPLINSYHLAALAERETLLGQLRRTPETRQWY